MLYFFVLTSIISFILIVKNYFYKILYYYISGEKISEKRPDIRRDNVQYYQYFNGGYDYRAFLYKKELRQTVNSLGCLMLMLFGAQFVFGVAGYLTLDFMGIVDQLKSGSPMELLFDGALSALIFFAIAMLYCLFKRLSPAVLFPFKPMKAGMLAMMVTIGVAFSLMSNFAADLVTQVFSLFNVTNSGGEILEEGSLPSVFLYYLVVSVLPALTEEFAFRGVVMGSLRKYSDALALIVSSALFALMHGNFVQMPFTFCCGLAFGYIAIKCNSLLPAIIIHFINNALAVTSSVLTSYHIVSDSVVNMGYGAIFVITGLLAFFFIRKLAKDDPKFFGFIGSDAGIPYRGKVKTAVTSPSMIIFAVTMLLYSVYVLTL